MSGSSMTYVVALVALGGFGWLLWRSILLFGVEKNRLLRGLER